MTAGRRLFGARRRKDPRFDTFGEALRASGAAYSDAEVADVVFAKTVAFRDVISQGGPVALGVNALQSCAAVAYVVGRLSEPVTVVDFGGACGAHYFACRAVLGDKCPMRWVVVESPEMCVRGRALETEALTFFDDLDSAGRSVDRVDLLHSSGAIQYTPDPMVTLRSFVSSGARFLFLDRLNMGDEHRISIQRTMLSWHGIGDMPESFEDREILLPTTQMSWAALDEALIDFDAVLQLGGDSRVRRGDGGMLLRRRVATGRP